MTLNIECNPKTISKHGLGLTTLYCLVRGVISIDNPVISVSTLNENSNKISKEITTQSRALKAEIGAQVEDFPRRNTVEETPGDFDGGAVMMEPTLKGCDRFQ